MRLLLTISFLFVLSSAFAQNDIAIRFQPSFGDKEIVFEDVYYHLPHGDSVAFDMFRCYISNVAFYMDDALVHKEKNSYHLVDAVAPQGLAFQVHTAKTIAFNNIRFDLGIDSLTNVSGVMGGDLDPTKGMYWTWQSGYVDLKLEGRSNMCKTRKNEFQFHLGGYAGMDNALQHVRLNTGSRDMLIRIPIDRFLSAIDLSRQNSIMIPGKEAVQLAHSMAQLMEVMP